MRVQVLFVVILLTAGCTAVSPTPSPTTPAPAAPIVAERPSRTPLATKTAVAATPNSIRTPRPTATRRPTRTLTPTPTPAPDVIWASDFEVVAQVTHDLEGDSIVWSPSANQFLTRHCVEQQTTKEFIFSLLMATSPNFRLQDISPTDVRCNAAAAAFQFPPYSIQWHPAGRLIVFAAEPIGPTYGFHSDFFLYDHQTGTRKLLAQGVKWAWMNESTIAISSYTGGGHFNTFILDAETGMKIADAETIHLGLLKDVSADYVFTEWGGDQNFEISAAVVGLTPDPDAPYSDEAAARPGFWGPYIQALSVEFVADIGQLRFNSRAEDWLPHSNEALVLTWDAAVTLRDLNLVHDTAVTSLQVWDVAADRLTMLLPGGVAGAFSPDGRFIAALTPATPLPNLQLIDRASGQVRLTTPITATPSDYGYRPDLHLAFSPDSRYLAFFAADASAANLTLKLYDVDAARLVFETAAQPMSVLWSPDGRRFVYRGAAGELALIDVPDGRIHPLSLGGGSRLRHPQWSFDGTYLSIEIMGEAGVETAVLLTK